MPLTNIQIDVLGLLASHRDPESYVAGATPLTRNGPRFSEDIDVFHDREERVGISAIEDAKLLVEAGYQVSWLRQMPLIYTAEVRKAGAVTRLEWVVDSDYRFFPTIHDDMFGYLLHPIDLALNKISAAVGRHEVRDIYDLVTIHENVLSLGAGVWAAVDKSPGFTPEGLIAEIRRNLNHTAAEWKALTTTEPVDPAGMTRRLRGALDEAEAFVNRMPTEKMGLLFLQNGKVVQPDPERLDEYETHAGRRRGQWPSSPEIMAAMLEHYRNSPTPPNQA